MRHSVLHVCLEGHASSCGCVDSANHADRAVRLRDELLAEEPDGLRGVRDCQVPGREARGCTHGDEDVTRVEAISKRVARVIERRLCNGVIARPSVG